MNNTIDIDNEKYKDLITNVINHTLSFEGIDFLCEVEVLFVDDDEIQRLNSEHRNIDRATDVLSFPMYECKEEILSDKDNTPVFLGSIVISEPHAISQANEYGHSLEREVAFLCAHSILHLLGYDHEKSKDDEKIHFSKQDEILKELKITR